MIYLDNSATTKPFPEVIESYTTVSANFFGNPSSIHGLGIESEKLLKQARSQISSILSVSTNEIYFTSGGTEGNNIALKGAARFYKGRGKHIITTSIEHDSIHKVVQQLEEEGYSITYVPVDQNGIVSVEAISKEIREDTILVSVMHVNNETGAIQPIEDIGRLLLKFPKIIFHVDGVQGIGKTSISIKNANIDLFTISAHKFHGLKGNGVLYIREGLQITPLLAGGGQERNRRSGTENVAGAVSTAKALRLQMTKLNKEIEKVKEMNKYLRMELAKIENVIVHSPDNSVPHILNFSVVGVKAEVFVHALEKQRIYLSTTSACSSKKNTISKTLLSMGVPVQVAESSFRISLSYQNTMDDMKMTIEEIKKTIVWLRGVIK